MKSAYTNNKLLKKYAAGIVGSIFRYLLLLSIGYVILYPMLYLITTSFRPDTAFLDPSRVWIPKSVTLERFAFAAKVMDYFNAFSATVSKELVAAALEVISCAVVGYGFARFNFPFKKVFTVVLFITILVPAPMIVIPQVLNFSRIDAFGILGLINKLTGVDLRANIMGTPLTFYLPGRNTYIHIHSVLFRLPEGAGRSGVDRRRNACANLFKYYPSVFIGGYHYSVAFCTDMALERLFAFGNVYLRFNTDACSENTNLAGRSAGLRDIRVFAFSAGGRGVFNGGLSYVYTSGIFSLFILTTLFYRKHRPCRNNRLIWLIQHLLFEY